MVHTSRRPHHHLLRLVVVLLTIVTATAYKGCCDGCGGCYHPLDNVNDPTIRQIAELAVSDYNKQQSQSSNRLVLRNVVRGYRQRVAGYNYDLVITAVNESLPANHSPSLEYEVFVFEDLPCYGGAMALRSLFSPLTN